jgi:pimeloyl-ACP methyl ester carboxylesterase
MGADHLAADRGTLNDRRTAGRPDLDSSPAMTSFRFRGHRITYDVHGEGDQALVLIHGLLMNRRMYDGLAPEMASRGLNVVTVDLLGHGLSDRPADLRAHSMTSYADLIADLVDHLNLDRPVIGGTSLGANVSLEFAHRHPEKSRGLFIEMPVLDNAMLAVAMIFVPMMFALRFGAPMLRVVSRIANRVPRSTYLLDIGLDWIRQDPEPSLAVLQGLMFGRIAPTREERQRIETPALVIGHPADPLHPFSDADMLVEEMPKARLVDANSIFEWRLKPDRLNRELAAFVEEVYATEPDAEDLPSTRAAQA